MPVELKAECESVDAEFDSHFGAPRSDLSAQARRHLAECETCRNLYGWLSTPALPVSLSPEFSGRIRQTLKSSLKPVRPVGSTRIVAAQLFLIFVILAACVSPMMGGAGWLAMTMDQLAGVTAVLMAGTALLSFSLAWQMTPGSLQRVPARTAVAILAAAYLAVEAISFPWHAPEAFLQMGLHCLRYGLTMAVPAALLFGTLVWRGAPLGIETLGVTLGAFAGLLALTILQFNCDVGNAVHLVAWHGAVLVVSALAGFLIGRAVNAVQRNRRQTPAT
jgi:hypothetical protein